MIFVTTRGGMYALNARGAVLWRKDPLPSQDDRIEHLLRRGQDIVVLRHRTIEYIDADTGKTKSLASVGSNISGAGATQSAVYFVDQTGLHSPDGGLRFAGATGVSADGNVLCVTSGKSEKECRITCLAEDGATERWGKPVEDEDVEAPVVERARVYAPAANSLTVFDADDGSVLWTTDERVSKIVPTEYGVFLSGGDIELRDPQTGEIRRSWPRIFGVKQIAVQGRYAAIIDLDGVLWLIDLSDPASES